MKNCLYFILFFLIAPFFVGGQAIIEVSNTSVLQRPEAVISVPWQNILSAYPGIDTANFIVYNAVTRKQLPYQLEYCGKLQIQNLLIQVSVTTKAKLVLHIGKGKPEIFPVKTYCRYVPEREDDFAWENDKIAFRAYGKALEKKINENAYGLDVWVKRTNRMVINERYKGADYHTDHGDGLDYYSVGFSLGAGDIAPFKNDSIWYSKNYRQWKVLDNGPLRSTFELIYEEWNVDYQPVKVVKTFTIDAGEQLNKIEAIYTFDKTPVLPVVVGIVKRTAPGVESFDEQNGMMGYWEPTDKKNGTTGVGCVFMQPVKNVLMEKGQLLSFLEAESGKPVIYYRGAAWDKAGAITSAEQWFTYLQHYQQKLKQPLTIVVHH